MAIIDVMLLGMTLNKKVCTKQDWTFSFMLTVILVLLFADSLSKANLAGSAGLLIDKIGTYLIYAGDPIGYLAALLYIDSWTSGKKDHKEKMFYGIVIGYVILNFVLITISALFHLGWFYYYTGAIYHHGPLYVVRGLLNMAFCAFITLYIFLRRKQIRTQYTLVVILFPLIILAAGFLQVFVGGASYEYAGAILACLLLFVNVQAQNVDNDYLTGLLNLRGFARVLDYQCTHYSKDHPFLVYLIDLDFFKAINDACGHQSGDEALTVLSGFLLDTFGRSAVIGRYGGDEFLVLSYEKNAEQAQKKLKDLQKCCETFNQDSRHPYHLSFSAGYAFYDPDTYVNEEQFFHHIDELMYREKKDHHALRNIDVTK
ncbi:MAG: diguanylate cyclase [Lactimicrobium sp.]|uniref:GGDEF domain-containing protein n=1 Tax=Lactimicrobium sp. TaxID=2563780 RepID=UPI002F352ADD